MNARRDSVRGEGGVNDSARLVRTSETDTATAIADLTGVVDVGEREQYLRQNRRFLHLLELGVEPGAWIAVEHDLVSVAQIPSGVLRRDLTDEISAMEEHIELRTVLDAVTGASVQLDRVSDLGATIEVHDAERTVVRVVVEGRRAWAAVLGGPAPRAEMERSFTIHVRRAPWRDRKNRRVARIDVRATEIHPDPEHSDL